MKNYSYQKTSNPNLERVVDLKGDWEHYRSVAINTLPHAFHFKRAVNAILTRGYAKGYGFYEALKHSTPDEWDRRLKDAGDRGDAIHQFIRLVLSGEKCDRHTRVLAEDNRNYRELTWDEWECVLAFEDFCLAHAPRLVCVEESVEGADYAGTLDQIWTLTKKCDNRYCKCEPYTGKLGLNDVKTGKDIYPNYGAQVAALAKAGLEHLIGKRASPDNYTMILHLNPKTARGWKTKFYGREETERHFQEFLAAKTIDDATYKPFNPDTDIYDIPEVLSMKVERKAPPKPEKKATRGRKGKSVCCGGRLIGGVQCEVCGADGRPSKATRTPKGKKSKVAKSSPAKKQ